MHSSLTRDDHMTVLPADAWTVPEAVDAWRGVRGRTVDAILAEATFYVDAKTRLGHGNWLPFLEEIGVTDRTARRFMAIAAHADLSNRTHVSDLPPSWGTLAVLAQLPDGELPALVEAHSITPETTRAEAQQIVDTFNAGLTEARNEWTTFCHHIAAAASYLEAGYKPDPRYATEEDIARNIERLDIISATLKELTP